LGSLRAGPSRNTGKKDWFLYYSGSGAKRKGAPKKSIVKDRKVIPDPIDDRKFQE
jgi:hypothetical protein